MVETLKHPKWHYIQQMMQDSFNSNWYLAMLLIVSIVGFVFEYQLIAIATLLLLLSVNLIFCEDCTSSMFTFCLVTIVPLAMYGSEVADYLNLWWIAIFLPPAFIAHLILYPRKDLDQGDMLLPIGLYAIALVLGGVGSIQPEDYFKLAPLYYILVLGPAMICFYIYFMAYIPKDTSKVIDFFTRAMMMLGFMYILMWMSQLVIAIKTNEEFGPFPFFPYRQWKNNMGNFALLTTPFFFYASTYKKHGWLYVLLGYLEFGFVLLSGSKGATLVALLMFPFLMIVLFKYSRKKQNIFNGILIGLFIIAIILGCILFKDSIMSKIEYIISSEGSGRTDLYHEAYQNFISNPIFGVGIGYIHDEVYHVQTMSMFWYHSTFMQVMGSMGIIGIGTWGYLTFVRFKIICKKNVFNMFILMSFLGFEGYSMINTGDFSPFPFATFLTFIMTLTYKHNKYQESLKTEEAQESIEETITAPQTEACEAV